MAYYLTYRTDEDAPWQKFELSKWDRGYIVVYIPDFPSFEDARDFALDSTDGRLAYQFAVEDQKGGLDG